MALSELLGDSTQEAPIQIFATDLSETTTSRAEWRRSRCGARNADTLRLGRDGCLPPTYAPAHGSVSVNVDPSPTTLVDRQLAAH